MSRKRLTREASRRQTRRRVLAAAERLIARKGLHAASLENIAEDAGYSRGAFYANFRSKADLLIELLQHAHREWIARLRALRNDAEPWWEIQECLRDILLQEHRTTESFLNWTEARLFAIRDSKFRGCFKALLAEQHAELAELIRDLCRRVGVRPRLRPGAVAAAAASFIESMRLTMVLSPDAMTLQEAEWMLRVFLGGAAGHLAGPRVGRRPEGGAG